MSARGNVRGRVLRAGAMLAGLAILVSGSVLAPGGGLAAQSIPRPAPSSDASSVPGPTGAPCPLDVPVPTTPGGAAGATGPSWDLRCIQLFPTARGGDARGVVSLMRVPTPFGVAVTADGHHLSRLVARVEGLPDPASLGPYSALVAWATPLEFDRVLRLGPVTEGVVDLGAVDLSKYLVLVSAETSAGVTERQGPLVMRGRSPSTRMESHDMLATAPSAERGGAAAASPPASAGAHDHAAAADGWPTPPMYDGIPMLPGIMALRPTISPLVLEVPGALDPPEARPRETVTLPNGGTLDLTAGFVRRRVAGRDLVMLAFNGQHPGPLIRVAANTTVFVDFRNDTPFPTAVHWHGVRLDNRFDGVPGVTQEAVLPGASFRYEVHFPDAGVYWYHPHHREDVQQELGLAGNIVVEPLDADYHAPVHREEALMLDDILLDDAVVPFGAESANYMLMGRFGNVMLVNGEPDARLSARAGEVVRYLLTNASNTRTFNLSLRAASAEGADPEVAATAFRDPALSLPLKVVATDVGRFEREEWATNVVLGPAERYVVEVRYPAAGTYALVNHVQGINHRQGVFREEFREMARVAVGDGQPGGGESVAPDRSTATPTEAAIQAAYPVLRTNHEVIADIDRYRPRFDDPVDREIVLTLETDSLPLALEQSMRYDWVYFNPVEWTGTMPVMNWATSGREIAWTIREPSTGRENLDIDWRFRVGDVVKIRVRNDRGGFHAMQHPLHIHGQRFLVLEQDGVANTNLAWKDTALLPAGSTTDILLELSNPGRWMVHCHIAEHLESGMKFVFDVEGGRP